MSVEKKYLKSKAVCKVKFVAPPQIVEDAKTVSLAGEFNGWDFNATKLRKQKNGTYCATLDLEAGNEYQYRYVVNGERWENDTDADKYIHSNVGDAYNSVVVV